MSNILYLDDFKRDDHINGPFYIEERFFEHVSANNNSEGIDKERELRDLMRDITPVFNRYFDQLHNINNIDDLISSLQRVFVFLNQEIRYE